MAQDGSTGIYIGGSAVFFVMVNSDRVGNFVGGNSRTVQK
jgi:hypothetical protein